RDQHVRWCLLLEYLEGETLERHLDRYEGRKMPLPAAAGMIGEIADALRYMHGQGIIHRDVKPSNVMVRKDTGRAVIMDFGLGKWIDDSRIQALTLTGDRIGTPRYMAPEQVDPQRGVDTSTDIYQLCTLLFEMVTGRAAYEGQELVHIFG